MLFHLRSAGAIATHPRLFAKAEQRSGRKRLQWLGGNKTGSGAIALILGRSIHRFSRGEILAWCTTPFCRWGTQRM
jgi:hypothetical protein